MLCQQIKGITFSNLLKWKQQLLFQNTNPGRGGDKIDHSVAFLM
jgi:hypothetical protein